MTLPSAPKCASMGDFVDHQTTARVLKASLETRVKFPFVSSPVRITAHALLPTLVNVLKATLDLSVTRLSAAVGVRMVTVLPPTLVLVLWGTLGGRVGSLYVPSLV